jgi:Domain of unknown function (DUF4202)
MSGAAFNPERFNEALRRFDEENAGDPQTELHEGKAWPRELLYAHRLYDQVMQLAPEASEPLRLAARSQHICRWTIPRERYPKTREGYLQWRTELKQFHANKAGEILREVGYEEEVVRLVQDLNLKKNFPRDPESRVLEDALCLLFLRHQFAELAEKTSDEKMVNALRKSWGKMTGHARSEALKIEFSANEKRLIDLALKPKA